MKIQKISALEILDSRGNPTVSATVVLEGGASGTALVPSGASTGSYEAVELRDGDKSRFDGLGVLKAVANIEEKIAPSLLGHDASDQAGIDRIMVELDGTDNKGNLGANAILAVSLACARAAAVGDGVPLYKYLASINPDFSGKYIMPMPMLNILNGGKHANWATDIQEYMVLPVLAKDMAQAVRMGAEIYQSLKKVLKMKGYSISVGDEGGFAPSLSSNGEAFDLLSQAVSGAGYEPGQDVLFGIDAAATEFFHDGKYVLSKEGKSLGGDELAGFYSGLLSRYPIVSLEDIFAEDDWDSFGSFSATHPEVQVVGDDLYVTNVKRLEKGIARKTTNAILIKLNQIGTLTETISAINLAHANGMRTVVSHRSGETEDDFISDLAVATGSGQIKTGAPARSERTCKYNRLMAIAVELGSEAIFPEFPFRR
jgi:enolase